MNAQVSLINTRLSASAYNANSTATASVEILTKSIKAECTIILTVKNYLYVLPNSEMQWITQDNPLYYYIKSNTNWNIN